MREDAFRAFLAACGYTSKSQASRLSRARTVENRLRVDLDQIGSSDRDIAVIGARLCEAGVSETVLSNLLNVVRTYLRFRSGEAPRAMTTNVTQAAAPVAAAIAAAPRSHFVQSSSVAELMRVYVDVLQELRDRGVTRTANGPVGDYAEHLFARAFDWKLAGNSAGAYDATDGSGARIQIKGRRALGAGGRQLGAIRRLPDAGFDLLAAVLFDQDMQVHRAALIPYQTVTSRAKRVELTNSWRFMLSDDVWSLPTVGDATEALREPARTL